MTLPLAEFAVDDLFRWLFIFIFFVLPILKSVIDKKAKAGQAKGASDTRTADANADANDLDPWEQLLRGGNSEPDSVPTAPPVVRTKKSRGSQFKRIQTERNREIAANESTAKKRPVSRQKTRSDFSVEPDSVLAKFDTSSVFESPAAKPGLHENVAHIESFQSAIGSGSKAFREEFHSLDDRMDDPINTVTRKRRRSNDWRRAIALREVLGAPVALRSGESDVPGLR